MTARTSLGVLVSGSGTNLQAILDATRTSALPADVRVVISNVAEARALDRARAASVPAVALPHRDYPDRRSFDRAVVAALRDHGVEWVVLAGFMRLVTSELLGAFPGRVVNIHPALLPAFPGVNAQRQAVEYGVKLTGCTVHLVDEGTDTGPILAQRAIAVEDGDDEDSLRARLLTVEHALLVEVLAAIAEGRLERRPPGPLGRERLHLRPR
ncbi:MAG: phosphoribosylglycinamide formyltransferase [Deltaproteobacteria bacterium]|nr:phosphoribosylglycinamide formyltransferase [Deltaproteobacteria bacterium]